MESFIHFFQIGFFHVVSQQALYFILFVLLLTVSLKLNHWQRLLVSITAITISHFLGLLLTYYGIFKIWEKYLSIIIPLVIFLTALFHIFTVGKPTAKGSFVFVVIVSSIYGFIRGIIYTDVFKTVTHKSSSILISCIEISAGIWCGLLVLFFALWCIGYAFQFLFRFSDKEWAICISSIVIGYTLSSLLNFFFF